MRHAFALIFLTVTTCGSDNPDGQMMADNQPPQQATPAPAMPAGVMMAFAGTMAPEGWWLCDGRAVSKDQYPSLFTAIGTAWGEGGDGQGPLFNIPDLRGRFLRGVDNGAGNDPEAKTRSAPGPTGNSGDQVGSLQKGATALPQKPFILRACDGGPRANPTHVLNNGDCADPAKVEGGDVETRPANIAVNWIIKY